MMQMGRLCHGKLQKSTRKILDSIPVIRRGQTSTQVRQSDVFQFSSKNQHFYKEFYDLL
jgi:hypothetical protein